MIILGEHLDILVHLNVIMMILESVTDLTDLVTMTCYFLTKKFSKINNFSLCIFSNCTISEWMK